MINESQGNGRRRWLILVIVYAAQLAFAVIMQSVPPVLNLIINDLGISHAQAGLLMGIFALPGVFTAVLIGSLSDKYGVKYLVLLSLALTIFGTVFSAIAPSYPLIIAGRFITGLGAINMLVILPQFLSQWFLGKEIGIAMGVFNTGVPVGGILSFNLLPLLTATFSWRVAFWMGTVTSSIALILFLLFYAPPPAPATPTAPSPRRRSSALANLFNLGWPVWLVALSWMWFNAGIVTFATFAADFFVRHENLSPDYAARLTSFVMWGPFVLSTFMGLLIHKFPRQKLLICIGDILAGTAILLVYGAGGDQRLLLMFLVGIGAVFIPSSVFSLPAALVDEKRLGVAFGIISTTANISMIGGPFLVGWIRDFTGSYLASFITIAAFLLLSIVSILPLRKPKDSAAHHAS